MGTNIVSDLGPKGASLNKMSGNRGKELYRGRAIQISGFETVYCAQLEQRHTNGFASVERNKLVKLIENDSMSGTREVKPRHGKTAKAKIGAMKTLAS